MSASRWRVSQAPLDPVGNLPLLCSYLPILLKKINYSEQFAFGTAGVEHFRRKDRAYNIANFARPFRRRSSGTHYTDTAAQAHIIAQDEAVKRGCDAVSAVDILLGLMHPDANREADVPTPHLAARVLWEGLNISGEQVIAAISPLLPTGPGRDFNVKMELSASGKKVSDRAYEESNLLLDDFMGMEHLLLGLIRLTDDPAGQVLASLGVELEGARRWVRRERGLPDW